MKKRVRPININDLAQFGSNLRAERNRLKLSQDALGEMTSLDGRYISRLENGSINPTLTTIIAILKALNLPFEALYKIEKQSSLRDF